MITIPPLKPYYKKTMTKHVLLVCIFMPFFALGQLFGPQQVLIDDLLSVELVTSGDVTSNGYQDLLANGLADNRIVLIENTENGFEQAITITEGPSPRETLAMDIDDDGNLDVVFSIEASNTLKYIINTGSNTFSAPITIASNIFNIYDLKAVDLDGDNDEDILLGSASIESRWYENDNGSFTEHIITGPAGRSLEVADLDGDDDLDIVSSASGSQTCVWYENDGHGNFALPQVIRGAGQATSSVFISDLNGDDKPDVLVTVNSNDIVAWFENVGGDPLFGPQQNISNSVEFARRVIAADLDNDNDIDVVSGGSGDFDNIVWFENLDGLGNFSSQNIITEEVDAPFSYVAVDFDNDGDLDLASASRNNSTVAWYENTTILGVDGPKAIAFKVYPNPTSEFFVIQATQVGVTRYVLYNVQGKELQSYPARTTSIDARALPSGIYILALEATNGQKKYEKLVKK